MYKHLYQIRDDQQETGFLYVDTSAANAVIQYLTEYRIDPADVPRNRIEVESIDDNQLIERQTDDGRPVTCLAGDLATDHKPGHCVDIVVSVTPAGS